MDEIQRGCSKQMIIDEKTKLIATSFLKHRVSDVENKITFRHMTSCRFWKRKTCFKFPEFVCILVKKQDFYFALHFELAQLRSNFGHQIDGRVLCRKLL